MMMIRAAFRILLKGGQNSCFRKPGGGAKSVSAYQGGQALHAVHYNIYSKISRWGKHPVKGGECPLRPP